MKNRMSEVKTLTPIQSNSLLHSPPELWKPVGWYHAAGTSQGTPMNEGLCRPSNTCLPPAPPPPPQQFLQVFTIYHPLLFPPMKWYGESFTEKMETIWQESLPCSFLRTSGYHRSPPPRPHNSPQWSLRTWSTHHPLSSVFQTPQQFFPPTYLKIIFLWL